MIQHRQYGDSYGRHRASPARRPNLPQVARAPAARAAKDGRQVEELRAAMASPKSGLRLHYQPQVDAGTGCLTGFEALLRWTTEGGVAFNPLHTVELAARHGFAEALDIWVVQAVVICAGDWVRRQPNLVLAVNATSALLTLPSCARLVGGLLRNNQMPARNLCIEVTEMVLLNEQVTSNLLALRQIGVQLAIDDFGTGLSALSRLMDVPFDTVKLDRSFIADRTLSPQDEVFLEAMVRLGHARGASVTIEGVNRADDVELARRIGCDTCQGFWFAPALSAEEAEELVSSDRLPWQRTTPR
jgi:EAL domain-containing protein (putative c-di-GMP-specific phosphodiesterase class I)